MRIDRIRFGAADGDWFRQVTNDLHGSIAHRRLQRSGRPFACGSCTSCGSRCRRVLDGDLSCHSTGICPRRLSPALPQQSSSLAWRHLPRQEPLLLSSLAPHIKGMNVLTRCVVLSFRVPTRTLRIVQVRLHTSTRRLQNYYNVLAQNCVSSMICKGFLT